jgi:hypothetical protein
MTRLETALANVQSCIEQQEQMVKWIKAFHDKLPRSIPKKTVKQLADFIRYLEHNL